MFIFNDAVEGFLKQEWQGEQAKRDPFSLNNLASGSIFQHAILSAFGGIVLSFLSSQHSPPPCIDYIKVHHEMIEDDEGIMRFVSFFELPEVDGATEVSDPEDDNRDKDEIDGIRARMSRGMRIDDRSEHRGGFDDGYDGRGGRRGGGYDGRGGYDGHGERRRGGYDGHDRRGYDGHDRRGGGDGSRRPDKKGKFEM